MFEIKVNRSKYFNLNVELLPYHPIQRNTAPEKGGYFITVLCLRCNIFELDNTLIN